MVIRGLPESDETEDKSLANLQSIPTAVLTELKQYGIWIYTYKQDIYIQIINNQERNELLMIPFFNYQQNMYAPWCNYADASIPQLIKYMSLKT